MFFGDTCHFFRRYFTDDALITAHTYSSINFTLVECMIQSMLNAVFRGLHECCNLRTGCCKRFFVASPTFRVIWLVCVCIGRN